MTALVEIGEYQLVEWLRTVIPSASCMAVPVGNDSAGLKLADNVDLLVNTDGVPSSLLRSSNPEDGRYVGRFCVTHVLSDIICMGGIPVAFLSNLHMTRETSFDYLQALVLEMQACLKMYDTHTIGGDLKEADARSVIGIGLGFVGKGKALTRAGARVGDVLAITLTEGKKLGFRWAHEVARQFDLRTGHAMEGDLAKARFNYLKLPCSEIQAAYQTGALTSAMDTSDGLLACVRFLGEMSQVSFLLYEDAVLEITDPRLQPLAEELSVPLTKFAFNAGYDWEVVCTIQRSMAVHVQEQVRRTGGDIAIIGEVTCSSKSTAIRTVSGQELPLRVFADERFLPKPRRDPVKTWRDIELY